MLLQGISIHEKPVLMVGLKMGLLAFSVVFTWVVFVDDIEGFSYSRRVMLYLVAGHEICGWWYRKRWRWGYSRWLIVAQSFPWLGFVSRNVSLFGTVGIRVASSLRTVMMYSLLLWSMEDLLLPARPHRPSPPSNPLPPQYRPNPSSPATLTPMVRPNIYLLSQVRIQPPHHPTPQTLLA